jgi:hypothetical protein
MDPAITPVKLGARAAIFITIIVSVASNPGAVRNVVGIRCGALSGNMKISFQAARSIG